jgi:hypothetical protein
MLKIESLSILFQQSLIILNIIITNLTTTTKCTVLNVKFKSQLITSSNTILYSTFHEFYPIGLETCCQIKIYTVVVFGDN